MELMIRTQTFYVAGRINGKLHRVSTGIRVGEPDAKNRARVRLLEIEKELRAEAEKEEADAAGIPTFAAWWATYQATYSQRKAKMTGCGSSR